jgi:transcriptional regulator with XRE-family HTH domain
MQSPLRQSAVLHFLCVDGTARRVRTVNGYSLTEVGAVCGVTESAVSRWECGLRIPRGEPARRYTEFLEALLAGVSES